MTTSYTLVVVFLIYFLAVSFLSSLNPVYISFRKVYLFRCLFPSWKFYEDVCYMPILYCRTSSDGDNFSPWQPVIEKLERNWRCLFLNPEGNLSHAYSSLLQQLESDKEDIDEDHKDDLVQSVSYQLTKNLVRSKLDLKPNEKMCYQFKLTLELQGNSSDGQDILFSLVHEA